MNSRIENDIFLGYVIVDSKRNGMEVETLAFDNSYQQECQTLYLDDDDDNDDDDDQVGNVSDNRNGNMNGNGNGNGNGNRNTNANSNSNGNSNGNHSTNKASVRRSFSTPTLMGMFKIEPLHVIDLNDLKNMKKIASGSQSEVFIATYRYRQVAVKVMKKHYENEIDNLRRLKHRNIVDFIGACSENNQTFIVIEYCHNGRLFDYLHNPKNSINTDWILEWAYQIASGMAYLHRHNIIHRDLKSPNILIDKNFTLKISDFGLSKQKLTDSAKMPFVGTVSWMAPEVIRMENCSETVDIWSYGVVLWELLTLQIPYRDFEQTTIIFGIGNFILCLPTPITFFEPFRTLIRDCWNYEPEKRPSFKEILKILKKDGQQIKKINEKKFLKLKQDWIDEYEMFELRKDLFCLV